MCNRGHVTLGQEVEKLEGNWFLSLALIFQSAKYSFAVPCYTDPRHSHAAFGWLPTVVT